VPARPPPADLAAALALDVATLRELLAADDDAPARLWAAWALALRHHAELGGVLDHAAHREPAAGVRAHLAVLLVGHGDLAAPPR
jgi:hypothetical protein